MTPETEAVLLERVNSLSRDIGELRRREQATPQVSTSGTWTPVLSASMTSGSFTYAYQVGTWYRIGRVVHLAFALAIATVEILPAGAPVLLIGLPDFGPFPSNPSVTFGYRAGTSATITGLYNGLHIILYDGAAFMPPAQLTANMALTGSVVVVLYE